jgi:hypothetical protein
MADRKKKKKRRSRHHHHRSDASNKAVEEDVLERAMKADCSMLMSSASFGSLVTLLIQFLTLLVILLLSIVLSLLHDDRTAISYITLITLLITLLVHELGVTRWNTAYSGTFRLVILWNLWVAAAVLFKLYSELEVFGRVMAVLISVFSTAAAVVSLCIPSTIRTFSFVTVLLILFPLTDCGLFGDSTLLLSVRLSLYILLCIGLDRLYPEAGDVSSQLQRDLLCSVCCFWVLLVLPQFWVAAVLLLVIAWYRGRQHRQALTAAYKERHKQQQHRSRSPSPILSPPHSVTNTTTTAASDEEMGEQDYDSDPEPNLYSHASDTDDVTIDFNVFFNNMNNP